MHGEGREKQGEGGQDAGLHSQGHTHTHTGKDHGRQSLPHLVTTGTSKKDQASTRHFSPSYLDVSVVRGWTKVIGLYLQDTLALSQGGSDRSQQLQKLTLHVRVPITSLLGVKQLPCYHHFKAGGLRSPLAADVQASGELIF